MWKWKKKMLFYEWYKNNVWKAYECRNKIDSLIALKLRVQEIENEFK